MTQAPAMQTQHNIAAVVTAHAVCVTGVTVNGCQTCASRLRTCDVTGDCESSGMARAADLQVWNV